MKCPDCREPIAIEATSCRCGWKAVGGVNAANDTSPPRYCRTVGCEQRAKPGHLHCTACEERKRHESSEAACQRLGLKTTEDKINYCRRMAKSMLSREPSFERWCKSITQAGIDYIALSGGRSSEHTLDRFRDAGVIDGRNQLIPMEARATAAEARRQERARQIVEVQKQLEEMGHRNLARDIGPEPEQPKAWD